MVKQLSTIGILLLVFVSFDDSSCAASRSIDALRNIEVSAEMATRAIRNKSHLVKVKMTNPGYSPYTIYFFAVPRKGKDALLPISFEIKHVKTGKLIKTEKPSPYFFYEKGSRDFPELRETYVLRPGEEFTCTVDIIKHIRTLESGTYEIITAIWLGPNIYLKSSKSINLTVSEE